MANNVTHRVVATGPRNDLEKFVNKHLKRDPALGGDSFLDFHTIIPIPKRLRQSGDKWVAGNWGTKWNSYNGKMVKQRLGVKEWFPKDMKEVVGERIEFVFDTAWSSPEPVFRKLAELFPNVTWQVASFDEGWLFGAEGEFRGDESTYQTVEPTNELFTYVYGHPPE